MFIEASTALEGLAGRMSDGQLTGSCSTAAITAAGVAATTLTLPAPGTGDLRPIEKITFGELRALGRLNCLEGFDVEGYIEAETAYGATLEQLGKRFAAQPSLDGLVSLIDNQPQLTVTLAQRFRDDIVGPDTSTLSVRWEYGTRNLNSVLEEFRFLRAEKPKEDGDLLIFEAYSAIAGEDFERHRRQNRFTFTGKVEHREAFDLPHAYMQTVTDPMTGMDSQISRMASVSGNSLTDASLSLLWTRLFPKGGGPIDEENPEETNRVPRLSLSVEAMFLDDDDGMRRKDRMIGRLSYSLPLPSGMSLPFTLTYANHGEFLAEDDDKLSAHIGLSYKFNRSE